MKFTGVISRFLPLVDVFIILLGVLMIALMYSQIRTEANQGRPSEGMAEQAGIDFVFLYAGWKGTENNRVFLLKADRKIGDEIRTDAEVDIKGVLEKRKAEMKRANQVVMLLFSSDSWDSAWTKDRLAGIEKIWKVKVNPVYNVKLFRQE